MTGMEILVYLLIAVVGAFACVLFEKKWHFLQRCYRYLPDKWRSRKERLSHKETPDERKERERKEDWKSFNDENKWNDLS